MLSTYALCSYEDSVETKVWIHTHTVDCLWSKRSCSYEKHTSVRSACSVNSYICFYALHLLVPSTASSLGIGFRFEIHGSNFHCLHCCHNIRFSQFIMAKINHSTISTENVKKKTNESNASLILFNVHFLSFKWITFKIQCRTVERVITGRITWFRCWII